MTEKSRTEAINSLAQGSQYLNCILSDSQIWLDLVGDGISKKDAVTFLLTRIHSELLK